MRALGISAISLLTIGLLSCGPSKPSLSAKEAKRLVLVADEISVQLEMGRCLDAPWPTPIHTLHPKSVCKHRLGIYIQVWSTLGESRGYLVSHAQIEIGSHRDPAFARLGESLYWFTSK